MDQKVLGSTPANWNFYARNSVTVSAHFGQKNTSGKEK